MQEQRKIYNEQFLRLTQKQYPLIKVREHKAYLRN